MCSSIHAFESPRGRSKLGEPLQLIRYINRASSGELIMLFAGGALCTVEKLLHIVTSPG